MAGSALAPVHPRRGASQSTAGAPVRLAWDGLVRQSIPGMGTAFLTLRQEQCGRREKLTHRMMMPRPVATCAGIMTWRYRNMTATFASPASALGGGKLSGAGTACLNGFAGRAAKSALITHPQGPVAGDLCGTCGLVFIGLAG